MNTKNKILAGLFSMAALFSSCNDFQEINEDPNQVDESKVKPEWFLNASIVGDQMNPEIAERMFILTWNRLVQNWLPLSKRLRSTNRLALFTKT